MLTRVGLKHLHFAQAGHNIDFEWDRKAQSVGARFILLNFGANVLAKLRGRTFQPDPIHEGSVLKINILLHRLPRLRATRYSLADAFCGTFHIDEGYEQMKLSYQQAAQMRLPDKVPC